MLIKFTKMHGAGNDFVVIDGVRQHIELSPEQLRLLANRHFGVGCDQILLVEKGFRIGAVNYAGFLRVSNLFDRINCVQVYVNTGTCDAGLRDFSNRRIGNTGDATTSTSYDQPEYIGARRSLSTGIKVNF